MKKVLVACEESQAVTTRMRNIGIEAYSCDTEPCSGGHPEFHLQQDVLPLLELEWDMIIAFPPCTYLTTTGNRWFDEEKYGDKARQRKKNRDLAIAFFMAIANSKCKHIAIENPVGIMSTLYRKPDQIIQPYMFGDPFEKRTCLWLKNLPLLTPTNIVEKPPRTTFASGKSMPEWYAKAWSLPKHERAQMRSKTFDGIANAMATQWCSYIDAQ